MTQKAANIWNRRGLIEHMVGNTQYASSHSYPALAAAPDRQQREEEYQVEVNYFAFKRGKLNPAS